MKAFLATLLIASLVANGALLFGLLGSRAAGTVSAPPAGAATAAAPTGDRDATAPGPEAADPKPQPAASVWQLLFDRDPARLAANLAAAGFPRSLQRGAVFVLLFELQADERNRLVDAVHDRPYWKPALDRAARVAVSQQDIRLALAANDALNALFPEEAEISILRGYARYGPLPVAKLGKLSDLERDYGEMRSAILSSSQSGMRMPWQRDELAVLDQERRNDIVALLTPQELEEYDLRQSPVAQGLRRQLADFNATEDEFRTLFRLQSAVATTGRAGETGSAAILAQLQSQVRTAGEIGSALGPARFADYERATDSGYRAAVAVTRDLQLPSDNAALALEIQRDIRRRAAAIADDGGLTAGQTSAQLAALGAEARQRLSDVLTPQGYAQYRRSAGPWMTLLDPPGPPTQ